MFLGRYEHTIDNKGRIAIPAKFRQELSNGMFVTRSIDKCLTLYPATTFQDLANVVKSLPISDPNARNFRRIFFSDAAECEFDKQGRVIIPADLRSYAEIDADDTTIMVVGVNNFIELWNKEKWLQVQQQAESNADAIASALSSLGL